MTGAAGPAVSGIPALVGETVARRLAAVAAPGGTACAGEPAEVEWDVTWHGPALLPPERPGSEVTVQALSGLMAVHGWDAGRPRRLGLEVASVAAGVLASNGVLAGRIGALRGQAMSRIETSVLQAGVWLVAHHIAAATTGGELLPSPAGACPGPPFRSGDGRWFEIEVFDAEGWKAFWERLGAGEAPLGRAWTAFRSRYYRGLCSLPPGLHQAAGRHPLAELEDAASACGVSLCPVRSCDEVLERPGPSAGHPLLAEVASGASDNGEGAPRWRSATALPRGAASGGGRLPLDGLRVVEATNRMQGPLAGLLLQMLGAEVVRVEPPGGDAGRMVPPAAGHVGSFFLCYNRGKSTVEIDLSRASGRDELRDLLATGDAFVHNWRPGKAQEWGLDPAALGATHPRLVAAEASGWGDVAENAGLIGTDFLVQAYAGYGDTLNPEGEPPLTSRALLTDCMGALVTCEGVLAGLYRRETTGRAPAVRTSLLQGAIAAQAHVLAAMASGKEARRCRGRPRWGPLDVPVETADGWLALSVDGDTALAAACRACAAEDGLPSRSGEALAARLRQGSAAGWSEVLGTAGVPCATVTADLSALPHDPRFSVLFEHLAGTCRAPASPWTITP